MKKITLIYRLIMIVIVGITSSEYCHAQISSRFNYKPLTVKQGEQVTICYKPEHEDTPVTGAAYFFRNFKWEGHDVPLMKTDTGYVSSAVIPPGTSLVCYRFWSDDTVDIGARFPYAFLVQAANGQLAPGAYSTWGLLRVKDSRGGFLPWVSPEAEIEPKVLADLWLVKEFNNLEVQRHLFFDVARGIKARFPEGTKADSLIKAKGSEILAMKNVTEREMMMVANTYQNVLYQRPIADSLKRIIVSRFPNGYQQRLQLLDTIRFSSINKQKPFTLSDFLTRYPLEKYPLTDYLDPSTSDLSILRIFTDAITRAFMNKEYDVMKSLISHCPAQLIGWIYDHVVDYPFHTAESPITREQQLDFSDFIVKEIFRRESLPDEGLSGRSYYAPAEWHRIFLNTNKKTLTFHAGLLYDNGNYAEAMKLAELIKPYIGFENIDFNALYTNLLTQFHKDAEAKQWIIDVVKAGKESPEMVIKLREYYTKEHGEDPGFEAYYTAMIPQQKTEEMHARIKKELIRVPAPDFTLQDMNGKEVNLGAQKGKIVVIDFWASWCFPCKQAMPGMETLVKKYKSDARLKFYFISTLEVSPQYKTLVTDFIHKMNYDFDVLYDKQNERTKRMDAVFDAYAKPLHLNGIPQKLIIDGAGLVRWVSSGFHGDIIDLVREVDYAISLIKQETSK